MYNKFLKALYSGRVLSWLLVLATGLGLLAGCAASVSLSSAASEKLLSPAQTEYTSEEDPALLSSDFSEIAGEEFIPDEGGIYTSKEDVALYINLYGRLPQNFITKKQAQQLGWSGGSLESYAPGKCIGGSPFGNYEGLLPSKGGRVYTECDIDTLGTSDRGPKRIVFSNDGLIYYTDDHYKSFTLLYGDDGE